MQIPLQILHYCLHFLVSWLNDFNMKNREHFIMKPKLFDIPLGRGGFEYRMHIHTHNIYSIFLSKSQIFHCLFKLGKSSRKHFG